MRFPFSHSGRKRSIAGNVPIAPPSRMRRTIRINSGTRASSLCRQMVTAISVKNVDRREQTVRSAVFVASDCQPLRSPLPPWLGGWFCSLARYRVPVSRCRSGQGWLNQPPLACHPPRDGGPFFQRHNRSSASKRTPERCQEFSIRQAGFRRRQFWSRPVGCLMPDS